MDNFSQEHTIVNRERIEASDNLNNDYQLIKNKIFGLLNTERNRIDADAKKASQ